MNIWLESRRHHKPLTSGSSGSPNPARNTHGHYAASKFTANTGAQALHVLNFNEVVTGILFECIMKLTAVLSLQTTPPGVSSCSRHPNAPSLILAAFQSVPITTKHICSSSQPSAIMFQLPITTQICNPSATSAASNHAPTTQMRPPLVSSEQIRMYAVLHALWCNPC